MTAIVSVLAAVSPAPGLQNRNSTSCHLSVAALLLDDLEDSMAEGEGFERSPGTDSTQLIENSRRSIRQTLDLGFFKYVIGTQIFSAWLRLPVTLEEPGV